MTNYRIVSKNEKGGVMKALYIKVISTGKVLPFDLNIISNLWDRAIAYIIYFSDGSTKTCK
jgi:hypothetical protein